MQLPYDPCPLTRRAIQNKLILIEREQHTRSENEMDVRRSSENYWYKREHPTNKLETRESVLDPRIHDEVETLRLRVLEQH